MAQARAIISGTLAGLVFSLPVSLITGLIASIFIAGVGVKSPSLSEAELKILDEAIFGGLIGGFLIGLGIGLVSGIRHGIARSKTTPNEGIKLSFRNAGLSGVIVGGFMVLSVWLYLWLVPFDGNVLMTGLIAGINVSIIAILRGGGIAVFRHYLLRSLLFIGGYLPWKMVTFLDYTALELRFLKKVGSGYMFDHRFLLEHFAHKHKEEVAA